MSKINLYIKDDFQVVLLLSCFVGHPALDGRNRVRQHLDKDRFYGSFSELGRSDDPRVLVFYSLIDRYSGS